MVSSLSSLSSGYVNKETILNFFYKITNERGTKTVFTYAHVKWFYGQSERAFYLNYFINLNTVVRSIRSQKFHSDLQHNTFLGNINMRLLWVLWASTKRIYQLSYNACTFWINKVNKSYTYSVVFLHVQWKIDFGWIDLERLVKMSGRFLTFDDKGLSYIPKASVMPMTKKKICF